MSALVLAASFFVAVYLGIKAKLEILPLHVMEAVGVSLESVTSAAMPRLTVLRKSSPRLVAAFAPGKNPKLGGQARWICSNLGFLGKFLRY